MVDGLMWRRLAAVGVAALLAGCQSGGGMLGMGERARNKPQEDRARITDLELRAYCPRLTVPAGRAVFTTYAKGGEGDDAKVVLQASLDDSSRSCTYGDGTLTLNVAVSGRFVSGPAASGGTVTVPIRITVVQGDQTVFDKVVQQSAVANPNAPAAQFVVSEPAIVIASPTARNIQVTAGFDIPDADRKSGDDLGL